MATNDFLPFAVGGGANVETQSAWVADSALRSGGFQAGVAPSAKFNKALRQSSIMASVLAQFIADQSGENSVDDGSTATLLANLEDALASMISAHSSRPGEIAVFAMTSAPDGYLKANGAAVSRTVYSALFAAIGTTFGVGDGSTTFNVPDLRGEFVRAWDDSRGVDSGRAFGSAQGHAFGTHNHGITDPGHAHDVGITPKGITGSGDSSGGQVNFSGTKWTSNNGTGITVNNAGGSETRPRNIALLYCIKY